MRVTNQEGYSHESVPIVGNKPPYPAELLTKSKNFLQATLAIFKPLGPRADVAPAVFQKYPIHAERAKLAAEVIGVQPVDVLAANLCYDVLMGMDTMGCSTLALPGKDGPFLARNMDWFPAEKIAKASCLVNDDFGVNAGFIGMLGVVTGLSRNGFCLCLNAAFGGSDPEGYPTLLFLRHVLDTAKDFSQALAMVTNEPLMSGGIITIIGVRNEERAIVERTPRESRVRVAKVDEPLMATNHYRKLAEPEVCPRYAHLAEYAGTLPAMEILTSSHVLQEITAQHVVMCPATQSVEMFVPSHLLPDDVQEEMSVLDLLRFVS